MSARSSETRMSHYQVMISYDGVQKVCPKEVPERGVPTLLHVPLKIFVHRFTVGLAYVSEYMKRVAALHRRFPAIFNVRKYALPLVIGVFIAMVWMNIDEHSYHKAMKLQ